MAVTFQDKVYRCLSGAPEDMRKEVLWALLEFAEGGVMPPEDAPWRFLFDAFSEDCADSHDFIARNRENAAKGGRPRKAQVKPTSESGKNPTNESGKNPNPEVAETHSVEWEKPTSESGENPNPEVAISSNLIQSNLSINTHSPRARELARAYDGFEPPSLEEVRSYAEANGLRDPDGFWAYYDSQGWVAGNGLPLTSWQSRLMRWSADERSQKKKRKSSAKYAGV